MGWDVVVFKMFCKFGVLFVFVKRKGSVALAEVDNVLFTQTKGVGAFRWFIVGAFHDIMAEIIKRCKH